MRRGDLHVQVEVLSSITQRDLATARRGCTPWQIDNEPATRQAHSLLRKHGVLGRDSAIGLALNNSAVSDVLAGRSLLDGYSGSGSSPRRIAERPARSSS